MSAAVRVIDLGQLSYDAAYARQVMEHEEVLAAREAGVGAVDAGRILLVEHVPAVITVSRRAGARAHLVATEETLARESVEVAETDRGGDITYHGPGQIVAYPILDLNHYHLGLHAYMRLLEQSVIDTLAAFAITGERDPSATGVWVRRVLDVGYAMSDVPTQKIAAMGVRVRRWVSMHGLALNVNVNLEHFQFIVPCGLVGRGVTSMDRELGAGCPSIGRVKEVLAQALIARLAEARAAAEVAVEGGSGGGR
jgi:lipoyl(octanoyl) transferase